MAKKIPQKAESHRITLSSYQREAWEVVNDNTVSILAGEAGCGKTFTAMWYGIQAIQAKEYDGLVVIRSPLEAGKSRMGFLPGGADEKMAPWCVPILEIAKDLRFVHTITFMPTCYVQGVSFNNKFVIVDECQNLQLSEWEAVATRLGKGSKICFTGDAHQDTRHMNGMRPFMDATGNVLSIGQYLFPDDANQRHPVVRDITRALRAYRERNPGSR